MIIKKLHNLKVNNPSGEKMQYTSKRLVAGSWLIIYYKNKLFADTVVKIKQFQKFINELGKEM